jgi:outer membrane protein OmpA-like peptidoglycan-associated protein
MLTLAWLALIPPALADLTAAPPGCPAPLGLTPPEGATLLGCQGPEADEATLPLAAWNQDPDVSFWDNSVRLTGQRTRYLYAAPTGRSPIEVMRAYAKAMAGAGYEFLFECAGFLACGQGVDTVYSDDVYGKRIPGPAAGAFARDSVREPRVLVAKAPGEAGTTYAMIFTARQDNPQTPKVGKGVAVFVETIVSQGGGEHLVLLRTDELAQGIDLDGRIPIYGVYFDPGSAEIKPESADQLAEIARLLRNRPTLALHVVGHTDNQGEEAQNLDLSQRRAAALVAALTGGFAIEPARLMAHGLAGLAPVAPNSSEEGRAMNRRIELVAR